MDRLSSCYFCGSALDASLVEYAVVPARLDPDDDQQAEVVLCQGCHRKLDDVIDRVVASVDDASHATTSTSTSESDTSNDVASPDGLETAVDADETGSADPDSPDSSPDPDADVDGVTDPPAGAETTDERSNGTGSAASADARAGSEDAGGDDAEEGQTISALEYNKVMRLIQNREFPVDRGEIETVAASAYDVERADCARIVDAAVERGLLEEDRGQLHKPESDP